MPLLTSLLGGVWFRVVAVAFGAAVLTGGGAYAGYHWESVQFAEYRATVAQQQAVDATAALKKLQTFVDTMQVAGADYEGTKGQLFTKLDSISKEFRNAIKPAPLPADCRPDAPRVQSLAAAVAAANAAADPEAVPSAGTTVRTPPGTN